MRRFFLLVLLVLLAPPLYAASTQVYQDYLYQYDLYRQKLSDFKIARTEYQKFQTLSSETEALTTARNMLIQRNRALRAYLLLLNEKLAVNQGLNTAEKQLYQTLIKNEITFLENHSRLIPSLGSLPDAERASEQLVSHYDLLSGAIRQTIAALSIGELSTLAKRYDSLVFQAQAIINANRQAFAPEKQATLDRWLLSISNKRSLHQQKVELTRTAITRLSGDINELDREFAKIQQGLSEAKQYLIEGAAFMNELVAGLKYQD